MKIEKELKSKINYLFDILKKNDVKELTISFYGSGDDGTMEVSDIRSHGELNLEEPTIYDLDLRDLIYNISDHILDKRGVDYENGHGNNGCIIYTVEGKQVDMEYLVTKDAEYSFNV